MIVSFFGHAELCSESIDKEKVVSFLEKEIFIPCDMRNTTFVPSTAQYENLISMHTRQGDANAAYTMPGGCIFEDIPCTHYLGQKKLVPERRLVYRSSKRSQIVVVADTLELTSLSVKEEPFFRYEFYGTDSENGFIHI